MGSDSAEKGFKFEKYVLSLFDLERYDKDKAAAYKIVLWTGDYGKNTCYKIETDSEPDLIIRHLESNIIFAVECKYRSRLYDDKIDVGKPRNLNNYKMYAYKNLDIPTFVVFGLGGQPDNPDQMFCVPIFKIKYFDTYINYFREYERDPKDVFLFDSITRVLS